MPRNTEMRLGRYLGAWGGWLRSAGLPALRIIAAETTCAAGMTVCAAALSLILVGFGATR